jgi:hypothetical protein
MRTRTKLTLTTATASLLMALAVSFATAGRISSTNRSFRATWSSLAFFTFESEAEIRCPVTLESSFHSGTIRKTRGALIGALTRGIVKNESCTGGRVTVLQETLPWHFTYESFAGTLPAIRTLTLLLRRYQFRIEMPEFAITCLYSDQGRPEENLAGVLTVNEATGQVTEFNWLITRYASWRSGSIFCPRRGGLEGVGQTFMQNGLVRITITLI